MPGEYGLSMELPPCWLGTVRPRYTWTALTIPSLRVRGAVGIPVALGPEKVSRPGVCLLVLMYSTLPLHDVPIPEWQPPNHFSGLPEARQSLSISNSTP